METKPLTCSANILYDNGFRHESVKQTELN